MGKILRSHFQRRRWAIMPLVEMLERGPWFILSDAITLPGNFQSRPE